MTVRAGGALPTFVVIGAQKCGTTALHGYLAAHPGISMSSPKELDFFRAEGNWSRGLDWYRGHFDPGRGVRGESSPNYTSCPHWPGVPGRMAEVIPDARLVYLVRDPIDRIAAHWVHQWARRREPDRPAEALRRRGATYVDRSRYMLQIDQFLERYPAERVLVVDQADLRHRRTETLERVFGFLGVDPGFRDPRFDRQVHTTAAKGRVSGPGAAVQERVLRSPLRRVAKTGPVARIEKVFARRPIEPPDIAAVLPPEAWDVLRADAARLRAFTGLPLASWRV